MKKVLLTMIIIVLALAAPAFGQGFGGSKLLQASWEQGTQPGGTGSISTRTFVSRMFVSCEEPGHLYSDTRGLQEDRK